jgi:hypothetical protein
LGGSESIMGISIISYGKNSLDLRPTWVTASPRERTEFVSQGSTVYDISRLRVNFTPVLLCKRKYQYLRQGISVNASNDRNEHHKQGLSDRNSPATNNKNKITLPGVYYLALKLNPCTQHQLQVFYKRTYKQIDELSALAEYFLQKLYVLVQHFKLERL